MCTYKNSLDKFDYVGFFYLQIKALSYKLNSEPKRMFSWLLVANVAVILSSNLPKFYSQLALAIVKMLIILIGHTAD